LWLLCAAAGELLTGCLQRLQRRQGQHHHASEQRDQLQREVREVFGNARRRYLMRVLQLQNAVSSGGPEAAGTAATAQLSLKALEALVVESAAAAADGGGGGTGDVRLQCAAAYLVIAHRWLIKQRAAAAAAGRSSAAAAAGLAVDGEGSDEGSSDDEDEDGMGDWVDDETGTEQQQQQQYGWRKGQSYKLQVLRIGSFFVHA
jgi:hypothetical protein